MRLGSLTIGILVVVVFAFPKEAFAIYKPKDKVEKYFDINEDGILDRWEYSLLQTHRLRGWELIRKKKQKPYDFNKDHMLQPFEKQAYLEDKARGTLLKNVKGNDIVVNPYGIRFRDTGSKKTYETAVKKSVKRMIR